MDESQNAYGGAEMNHVKSLLLCASLLLTAVGCSIQLGGTTETVRQPIRDGIIVQHGIEWTCKIDFVDMETYHQFRTRKALCYELK